MKDDVLPKIVHDIVEKVCKKENIIDYNTQLHQGNVKGAGFLGEISFITITDKSTKKELNLVVKKAFMSEFIRTEAPIRDTFLNEIYFYTQIWPSFTKLQINANVKDKFKNIPKCYLTSSDDEGEMLVMENLKKIGYELVDKKIILNADYIELIFKEYGRFHALSFAYKQQQPEEYSKLCGGLRDMYIKFLDIKHFQTSISEINKLIMDNLVVGEDDLIIKAFEKYLENGIEMFRESMVYEGQNSAILHGDCWSNNMMFKYNNSNKLTNVALLDWQLSRVGTPVCDLSYCLYSGASTEIFDKFDYYLKLYHDSFSNFLTELGGDPSVFTLEDLKEDWRKYSKFGLIMGTMVLRMKLTNDDDIIDLTDMNAGDMNSDENRFMKTPFNEKEFVRRVKVLLTHMHKINSL